MTIDKKQPVKKKPIVKKPVKKKPIVKKPVKKKPIANKVQKRNIPGKPSPFDPMIDGFRICSMLVDGSSVRSVLKVPGMPSRQTFFTWLSLYPQLLDQYKQAIVMRAMILGEDIIDIADDGSNDYMQSNDPENPGYRINGEAIQRSRLRVDSRKWVASRLIPKLYGDKVEVGGKLDISALSDDDIKAEIAALVGKEIASKLTDE
jgi:hypothetical protein